MYLIPNFYIENEEKVRTIIADVIAQYANGEIDYTKAEFNARVKIYQSVNPAFNPDEEFAKDTCYRDILSVEQTVVDSICDMEKIGGLKETIRSILLIPSLNADKCKTPYLNEERLKEIFVELLNSMINNKEEIIDNLTRIIEELTDTSKLDKKIQEAQESACLASERIIECVYRYYNGYFDSENKDDFEFAFFAEK